MSTVSPPVENISTREKLNLEGPFSQIALVLGAILTLIMVFLTFSGSNMVAASDSYIFAWIFWLSVTVGCFIMYLLYHLIRGRWLLPTVRLLEVGGGPEMLIFMAILFIPMILPVLSGKSTVYAWSDPVLRNTLDTLKHKAPYLNPGFWTFRWALYFVSWAAIAAWFRASTNRQEKLQAAGDPDNVKETLKRNNFAGPAFIWLAVSATLMSVDYVMSVDYRWFSTMYGLWSLVAYGIGGFSFVVLVATINAYRGNPAMKKLCNMQSLADMTNILFVLTMLWAYTSFSQYLITYSGNLPETTFYYVERSTSGWAVIGAIVLIGQFFMPFVMLLTPRNKKAPLRLARIAGWMLFIHIFDTYQYVMPALRHGGPMPTVLDFVAFFGVGLLWLGVFALILKKKSLLPMFDRRWEEVNEH